MTTNKKADTRCNGVGSDAKTSSYFTGNRIKFSGSNYREQIADFQCAKCRSDYMKFAVNKICQRCQQRVEYIIRKRSRRTGGAE
jgi:hypothetical protein